MDFLETGWNLRNISDDPQYRKSYSTQYNQIGRCQYHRSTAPFLFSN